MKRNVMDVGNIILIGCPKLDAIDYSLKLTEIFKHNDIQGIRLVRMEVPCCGGMDLAIQKALANSGKTIPYDIVTISIQGTIC